jgi:alanine racemase
MHRLGFHTNEMKLLCDELQKDQFRLTSVFSHLAASDEPALDDFSRNQIDEFEKASNEIQSYTGKEFLRHILNSSGIDRFPEAQFDMVRLGIGLYGVSSFSDRLNEVSTFKTRITQIMELNEGDTVGYGRKGIITSKKRIATLPVGYADGLPRSLGNGKVSFLINSEPAFTIGNICMDMCMIDVTDLKVEEGDEVLIFGKDLSVNILARSAGTIPYEILSNISARVKRVYYRE